MPYLGKSKRDQKRAFGMAALLLTSTALLAFWGSREKKETAPPEVPVGATEEFDPNRRRALLAGFGIVAAGGATYVGMKTGFFSRLFGGGRGGKATASQVPSGAYVELTASGQAAQIPAVTSTPGGMSPGALTYRADLGQWIGQDGQVGQARFVGQQPRAIVSPVGISGAGSTLYNGGWGPYGPDTPGTQSGGLNEAITSGLLVEFWGRIHIYTQVTGFTAGQVLMGHGWGTNLANSDFTGSGIENDIVVSNTPAINLTPMSQEGVVLRDFAIRDGGHGIYCAPSGSTIGCFYLRISNVFVSGVGSSNYGLYLVNSLYFQVESLMTTGSLGIYLGETNGVGGTGNGTFTNCFFAAATAPYGGPQIYLNPSHLGGVNFVYFNGIQPSLGTEATQYAFSMGECQSIWINGFTCDGNSTTNQQNFMYLNGSQFVTIIGWKGNVSYGNGPLWTLTNCTTTYVIDAEYNIQVSATTCTNVYFIGGTIYSPSSTLGSNGVAWVAIIPKGFAYFGTPSLPAGTGSSNKVTNTYPYPVLVSLPPSAGENTFGTHLVDSNGVGGSDQALKSDPTTVVLPIGWSIYFYAQVPGSWLWAALSGFSG